MIRAKTNFTGCYIKLTICDAVYDF